VILGVRIQRQVVYIFFAGMDDDIRFELSAITNALLDDEVRV